MNRISFKPLQPRVKKPRNRVEFPVSHLVWNDPNQSVVCLECAEGAVIDLSDLKKQQSAGFIKSAGRVAYDKIHAFARAHWRCGEQVVVKT